MTLAEIVDGQLGKEDTDCPCRECVRLRYLALAEAVMEECAAIADFYLGRFPDKLPSVGYACDEIAGEIRRLKDKR